ncbi:MAG: zinc ribbon domain-containing protein [Chloroflexota bacterium]
MQCQTCGTQNRSDSKFCQGCGATLPAAPQQSTQVPTQRFNAPPPIPKPPSQPAPAQPRPIQPAPPPPGANIAGQHDQAAANIWGPFAGYGSRRRHVSWLLDNLGQRESELHSAITQRFSLRELAGSQMEYKTLTAQGVLVQKRPFYFVTRGITTAALYIAQFGKDLYISQTTYIKSPISPLRIVIAAVILIYQLAYPSWLGARIEASLGGGFFGGEPFPTALLCLGGPIYVGTSITLFMLVFYSLYKFLVDKDPVAAFRKLPDEFDEDDAVALEKSVEETVRQALDGIGIQSNIMPVAQQQSFGSGTSRLI